MADNEQPTEDVIEQVGQTALENAVEHTPAGQKSSPITADAIVAGAAAESPKPQGNPEKEGGASEESGENKRASSLPKQKNDATKSTDDSSKPAGPPPDDTKKKDGRWATANPIVKTLVIIGVAVVSLGLVVAFLNILFGIILMALGSLAIIACVFLPIGIKKG